MNPLIVVCLGVVLAIIPVVAVIAMAPLLRRNRRAR